MKNINNNLPHKAADNAPAHNSDDALRRMFHNDLPQAPADPWFMRKVMNRLPDKPMRRQKSIFEQICYLTGIIGLLAGWVYAITDTLRNGISTNMLIIAAVLPLISIFCISIFAIPAIKRSL